MAATAIYRSLTGYSAAVAPIDTNVDFDRHVFASLVAVAAAEDTPLAQGVGLTTAQLQALLARWFPHAKSWWQPEAADVAPDEETAMLRDLLVANRSTPGADAEWLAAMVARRAMEPNHLWEDLGLRDRSELSRLLSRHFGPLAARNTRNMRWKRFFYRALCEDDGLVMCSTPVCTACNDFHLCFGEETGESRLAAARKALALAVR